MTIRSRVHHLSFENDVIPAPFLMLFDEDTPGSGVARKHFIDPGSNLSSAHELNNHKCTN
jgi:hypothetical protein